MHAECVHATKRLGRDGNKVPSAMKRPRVANACTVATCVCTYPALLRTIPKQAHSHSCHAAVCPPITRLPVKLIQTEKDRKRQRKKTAPCVYLCMCVYIHMCIWDSRFESDQKGLNEVANAARLGRHFDWFYCGTPHNIETCSAPRHSRTTTQ